MKIELERIKTLVETGDIASVQQYIVSSLERSDVMTAVNTNADVKSFLDSEKDRHTNTALDTWKTNHLQGLIDDAVSKVNPTETPEQKQIRELTERIEQKERAEQRGLLQQSTIGSMTELGYDGAFATKHGHLFVGEDEAKTKELLTAFKGDFDSMVQAKVEATLKGNARNNPGGGTGGGSNEKSYGAQLAEQNVKTQESVQSQAQYFK